VTDDDTTPTTDGELIGEPWERPAVSYDRDASTAVADGDTTARPTHIDDDYTDAATDFVPTDASAGVLARETPRDWQRLHRRHETVDSDHERSTREHTVDARRYARTVCSQLAFSEYATARVVRLVDEIGVQNLDRTASLEATVFAYLTLVANEHDRRIRTETRFDTLVTDAGVERDEIRRLRDLVRETDAWTRLRER